MRKRISAHFDASHAAIFLCCFFLVVLAVIDKFTRHEIHLSFLYIVPIAVAAWVSGRRTAVLMSILSAVVWFLVDVSSEIAVEHGLIHLWNIILRTAFFLLVTYGVTTLSQTLHRQNELVEFIVHDLKAPLANASIAIEGILDAPGISPDVRNFANTALISGKRMLTLIHSIIDLAKLEAEKLTPKIEDASVAGITDDAVGQISMWAEKNRIVVSSRVDTRLREIRTDRWLVVRVITNLLSNAIKASPPDSAIKLNVKDAGRNSVLFSVEDEGPGIPKEWLPGIFDKFHHVQLKKSGVYAGSGLGLTFCKLAVTALGGKIRIESALGKGTVVSFEIPAGTRA